MSLTKRFYHDAICEMMPSPEPEYYDIEEYRRDRDIAARYADSHPRDNDAVNALRWLNRSVLSADSYQEILEAL